MNATIYLEGGGNSKEQHARCREGFRKLLEKCGLSGRLPRLTACGSRGDAFDDFLRAHKAKSQADYVGMLIDSEDPVLDIEATWQHVANCDRWSKPLGAEDKQVLLMTTCMETWIVADREAMAGHYGSKLQESALPPLVNLENRPRQKVQGDLIHATRNCSNAYLKTKRAFEILAKLSPDTLQRHLPSFARVRRILEDKLAAPQI